MEKINKNILMDNLIKNMTNDLNGSSILEDNNELLNKDFLNLISHIQEILIDKDIKSGDIIPIIVKPSYEAMACIYAMHMMGITYCPISLEQPNERKNLILSILNPKLILTNVEDLIIGTEIDMYCIDMKKFIGKNKEEPLKIPKILNISSDNTAYIIFTSGSTGVPKGVEVSYKNLEWFILELNNTIEFKNSDSYILSTPLQFDVSVVEIYGWILKNGTLVISDVENTKDFRKLINQIIDNKVTHLAFSPAIFKLLNDDELKKLNTSISNIMVAGEIFPMELVKRVNNLLPKVNIYNFYGPTETTVFATYHKVTSIDNTKNSLPIGIPMRGVKFKIDMKNNNVGELLIGGEGVAKGYFNDEEKTALSFVSIDNDRYYRTGDLVSYNHQKDYINFHGRIDHQLEVNGIRVEPEEIRLEIMKNREIEDTYILMEDKLLIAFIKTKNNIEKEHIRSDISNNLPNYMIPQIFIILRYFPLNVNGKVDRKELIKIYKNLNEKNNKINSSDIDIVAKKIMDILGKGNIFLEDNIFDYGIDSIEVLNIQLKLEKAFNVKLPLDFLYNYNNINSIKNYFQNGNSKKSSYSLEKLLDEHNISYDANGSMINIKASQTTLNKFNEELQKNEITDTKYDISINNHRIKYANNLCEVDLNQYLNKKYKSFESSIFQKVYTSIKLNSFIEVQHEYLDDLFNNRTNYLIKELVKVTEAFRTKLRYDNQKLINDVYEFKDQDKYIVPIIQKENEKISSGIEKIKEQMLNNLVNNNLIKILVYKTGINKRKIHIIMHHNIADGASKNILKIQLTEILNNKKIKTPSMEDYLEILNNTSNEIKVLNHPYTKKLLGLEPERDSNLKINILNNDVYTTSISNEITLEQRMMVVANIITKNYLQKTNNKNVKFQMLFNFRKLNNLDFGDLINDCHETLTFVRDSEANDISFMNKLYKHLNDFHYSSGISIGHAIYNNFPNFNDSQEELKKAYESAEINIDYIGDLSEEEVTEQLKFIDHLSDNLKNLKKQTRFLAFSSGEKLYIVQLNNL